MNLVEELPTLMPGWLPRQRWFGAKAQPIRSVDVASTTPLLTEGDPLLDLVLFTVSFTDGSPVQHYQLLVARREHVRGELDHVTIGPVGRHLAYDALWDPTVTEWLLGAIREGRTFGEVRFVPEPGAQVAVHGPGRVLGVEQSNTSVAWGEKAILKLFRRILPGVNPDLELHRALRSVGSQEVAALQGAIEGMLHGEPVTLGMLQDFAANSADGWSMALASVRDLLAEGDLRADEVGGDFAAEASRLGETVAVVHRELREALGTHEADPRGLAAAWHERLTASIAEVPALDKRAGRIRAAYDVVAAFTEPIPTQRVHGDLHLGQALRTPYGWLVIDFEGEPVAPLEERVRPDSALRDVAGMLRSFDYAAFHQLSQWEHTGDLTDSDQESQMTWHAKEWADRNRSAFCDGYALQAGADPRDQGALLRAFELDKAVYEVVYETRSRPAWAHIPLASIKRLTAQSDAGV